MADTPASLEDRATALLHAVDQRVTRARVAVLAHVIAAGDDHLTAEDLHRQTAAAVDSTAHRATIYRTLDSLTHAGVLSQVHLDRGTRAYHLAQPIDAPRGHLHGQCSACGRVVDLPVAALTRASARILSETGFQIDPAHVALAGTCRSCRAS